MLLTYLCIKFINDNLAFFPDTFSPLINSLLCCLYMIIKPILHIV